MTSKNAPWVCGAMMMVALQGCNGCNGCSCSNSTGTGCPAGQSKERESSTDVGNDYAINSSLGQSFSPGVSYTLVRVDLSLTDACKDQMITLDVYDSCANGTLKGSGTAQGLAGWTRFTIPDTAVTGGQSYCIKPSGKALSDACKWSLGTSNIYGRGDAWQSGNQILIAGSPTDFAFTVYSKECL